VTLPHRYRPLYGADNEDTRSELTALEIAADDTVVAVASGGGRVLSLLTAGPAHLIAIDRREDQLFNLELKAAALEALDYDAFLGFLGITPSRERLDRYAAIRRALCRSTRSYWDRRPRLVAGGIFYAGRSETAFLRCMRSLRALGLMRWADPFFAADCVEAQRALLETQRARTERGLLLWRAFLHPLVLFPLTQDPSFLRSDRGSVGAYLVERALDYVAHSPVRESYLLHFGYLGRVTPASPLPPYLTRTGFERARTHLAALEMQCGDLRDLFAARHRDRIKWSISDVGGWMSERSFHDLLRAMMGRCAPGSRFCARTLAARRGIPADLRTQVRRLDRLCDALDLGDSSVIYRFEVGERVGPTGRWS
jgi:S-adenosylmethionine-diacylglycerol 3-amino-3-carboxypropyl transferase